MSGAGQPASSGMFQGQDFQAFNGAPQSDPNAQWAGDFYVYTASFGNLAANATGTVSLAIQSDSNFQWIMSTYNGNIHGGTTPFSDAVFLPINITMQDGGSGRQLFSAPTPLTSIAGTGKQPFIMPVSRIFKPNSNFIITAQNFGADQYDNIFLNLIGQKLFKRGS